MKFLLDTNIVSEVRKGRRCDAGVANWYAGINETELFISVLVLGEIRKGVELARRRGDSLQADVLEEWLQDVVRKFSNRILPVNSDIVDSWGRLYFVRNVPTADGLMVATAKVHGLTLVTRNVSDVQGLGANIFNPFLS